MLFIKFLVKFILKINVFCVCVMESGVYGEWGGRFFLEIEEYGNSLFVG